MAEPLQEVVFCGANYNSVYKGTQISLAPEDRGKIVQLPQKKAQQILQDFGRQNPNPNHRKFCRVNEAPEDLPAHTGDTAVITFTVDRQAELHQQTLAQLKEIANTYTIDKFWKLEKSDLIEQILQHESGTPEKTEAPEPEVTTETDRYQELNAQTVTELKNYAKDLGMEGYSTLKKHALVLALIEEEE